jgi:hypothetical protein
MIFVFSLAYTEDETWRSMGNDVFEKLGNGLDKQTEE